MGFLHLDYQGSRTYFLRFTNANFRPITPAASGSSKDKKAGSLEATIAGPQAPFRPGGIHRAEVRSFWKEDLKAGDWVMDVIDYGYTIPWNNKPENYEEPNNLSALKNIEFVQQAVEELQRAGVVQFVEEKPRCVSPLTVAEKLEPDGSTKLRLCWDGSRCVNLELFEQKVTLAHLQRALEITREGDFQVVYDLKSAFHHIKIARGQTTYLGAAFMRKDGRKQFFIFLYLPFGLGSAVHCITKLFKPINAYLHKHGVRHSIYIDDGRVLAKNAEEAEKDRQFVYSTLARAGWSLEERKSDKKGGASQIKNYLGFTIDSKQMTVRLRQDKKDSLRAELADFLSNPERVIRAKDLAKITGKIISTEPAMGPMTLMASRAAYIQQEKTVELQGWQGKLIMCQETRDGIQFYLNNMELFDNTPIRTAANAMSVLSIVGSPEKYIKTAFVSKHVTTERDRVWASDASGYATCAYSIKGEHLYYRGELNEEEQKLSSGHRELLAVKHSLEYYSRTWGNNRASANLYWLTDSENLVSFLNKGSGKSHIQVEVFRVMTLCQALRLRIIPIHLLRDDPRIQVADQGSKVKDTDDWSVNNTTFTTLNDQFSFTIDLFASNENAKCPRFYSNFYCQGTQGIDAFCHNWDNEVAWICPPVKDIIQIVRKILVSNITGILMIPEWPTADFWLEIFDREGQLRIPFIKSEPCRPFLYQKNFNPKSPFHGHAKFNFLQLTFRSRKQKWESEKRRSE